MNGLKQLAIGDAMEIADNESKEVKKKLQELIKLLFQESDDIGKISDVATEIVLSEPQYRGILKSIVSMAIVEATVKVYVRRRVQ